MSASGCVGGVLERGGGLYFTLKRTPLNNGCVYCKQLKSARWRHYGPGPQQPLPAQAVVEARGGSGGVLTGESGVVYVAPVMVLVRVSRVGWVE